MKKVLGDPEKGGQYFTLWAPRQTGKTWLVQQVKKEIEKRHGDQFDVRMMSMQGVMLKQDDPPEAFLSRIPLLFQRFFNQSVEKPEDWETLGALFLKSAGLFEKPLMLFIDEFDKLPALVIDNLVSIFRDMYLDRDHFCLHSLALIMVRAVLGVESERGSPFNIQRSLHVPNFKLDEVTEPVFPHQAERWAQLQIHEHHGKQDENEDEDRCAVGGVDRVHEVAVGVDLPGAPFLDAHPVGEHEQDHQQKGADQRHRQEDSPVEVGRIRNPGGEGDKKHRRIEKEEIGDDGRYARKHGFMAISEGVNKKEAIRFQKANPKIAKFPNTWMVMGVINHPARS
jgi:hypothetical protein